MLRKKILVFFAFLLLIFLKSVVPVTSQVSQAQQSKPEVKSFTDLTLEISSSKESLLPLQPIPIVIKQSNKTNQPVLGYNSIGFGLSPLYLYVQKNGTTEKIQISMLSPIQGLSAYKNRVMPSRK